MPSPFEQQAIANTLNIIKDGTSQEIKKLQPHSYRNLPHFETGAVLPPSIAGYKSYTVPLGQFGKGESRLIIDQETGDTYYINKHCLSFYHVVINPKH